MKDRDRDREVRGDEDRDIEVQDEERGTSDTDRKSTRKTTGRSEGHGGQRTHPPKKK